MSKKKEKQPWETADLRNWIRMDLDAALAFLSLLKDNQELFELIVVAVEQWRTKMVENERTIEAAEKEIAAATTSIQNGQPIGQA